VFEKIARSYIIDTQVGDFLAGFASLGFSIRILLFAMMDLDLPTPASTPSFLGTQLHSVTTFKNRLASVILRSKNCLIVHWNDLQFGRYTFSDGDVQDSFVHEIIFSNFLSFLLHPSAFHFDTLSFS
jgi:hypothetical protein